MTCATRHDGKLTIGQAAKEAGTTPSVLRVWSLRYGWPSPARSRTGYRLYDQREVEQIRLVLRQQAAGGELGRILGNGSPPTATPPTAAPAPAVFDLDLSSLRRPRTDEAFNIRTNLVVALIRRDPGSVRWYLAVRARLSPFDREHAVDGVLRLAAQQLNNPTWLKPLLEPIHAL